MAEDIVEAILKSKKVIDVGEVRVTRSPAGDKERFLIYLPVSRNYLWRLIWDSGKKVRVYIEVVG